MHDEQREDDEVQGVGAEGQLERGVEVRAPRRHYVEHFAAAAMRRDGQLTRKRGVSKRTPQANLTKANSRMAKPFAVRHSSASESWSATHGGGGGGGGGGPGGGLAFG